MAQLPAESVPRHGSDMSTRNAARSGTQAILIALLIGLCVFVVRGLIVFAFGSSTPFWDQWGAESSMLYRPMLLGQFDTSVLWLAHNEHRIALTRLVAMALFELNDAQWDCRIAALFNVAIYAAAAALLAGLVARHVPGKTAIALVAVVALVGLLPYGWENALSSFQTGFHLLFLLTVLLLWCVAGRPPTWSTFLIVALLVALLHFTIASNLFVLMAGIGVVGLRGLAHDLPWRSSLMPATPLVAGLALAVITFPHDPTNPFVAKSAREFFAAWMTMANWPGVFPAVLLFAIPCMLALFHLVRRRDYRPMDGFFAGLFGIGVLTCAATALNRGHNLIEVTSRYADMLALAGMAPIYFALTRTPDPRPLRRWARDLVGLAAASMFLVGLVVYSVHQWSQMQQRRTMVVVGTGHARGYLDGDTTALDGKQQLYALYPFPGYLPNALDDTLVRAFLPLSLFAPGPRPLQQPVAACAWNAAERGPDGRPNGQVVCGGAEASGRVRVGTLTAIGYRLWQALDLHPLPELKPAAVGAAAVGEACSIDLVNLDWVPKNKRIRLNYAPALRLIGWSIHKGVPPDAPLELALVSGAGAYSLQASVNAFRPELEMFHKDPTHTRGGFDFDVDSAVVAPGDYRILLRRGDAPFCDSGTTLSILRATDERMLY